MAQYFLTDYSPDHADVDFDFALPDGHCSAKLAYISDHGSQTLQIEFMVHGDEGIVGDSSTAIASSKASQEGTLSPASTLRPVVPESTPMSPSRTRTVEITTAIHGEHASKIVDSGVTSTFETFVSDSPSPTVIVAPTVSPTAKPHEEEKRPADHDGQAPTYPLSAGTWVGIALGVGVVLIFLTLAGAHVVYRHSLLPRALRRDREKTAVPTNSVEPYVLEEGNPHQIRSVSRESTSRQFSDWQCDSISARDIPNPSTTTAPASDAIQPGCSNSSEEMDGLGMDLGESDGPPQYEK
ncbi:hypothetical protein L227DRAFT_571183 [Lentinus tigrinus ALCF2SS1-6]|uniref:Uncharacterized protein n=2 Tax=Lentinus tigrinus TaxID=5365 RepID=A0A5C2SM84_9APHY|nr:hypothetical protein L227DRAFT_571183 [Lentinus tigrinus ALCF2SS1-6]